PTRPRGTGSPAPWPTAGAPRETCSRGPPASPSSRRVPQRGGEDGESREARRGGLAPDAGEDRPGREEGPRRVRGRAGQDGGPRPAEGPITLRRNSRRAHGLRRRRRPPRPGDRGRRREGERGGPFGGSGDASPGLDRLRAQGRREGGGAGRQEPGAPSAPGY